MGGYDDRQLPPQWRAEYEDPELAREFAAAPLGPYSDRLSRLLHVMKSGPVAHRPVLVERADGRIAVGRLPTFQGDPYSFEDEPADDLESAERRAFAIRWRTVFGTELPA